MTNTRLEVLGGREIRVSECRSFVRGYKKQISAGI